MSKKLCRLWQVINCADVKISNWDLHIKSVITLLLQCGNLFIFSIVLP